MICADYRNKLSMDVDRYLLINRRDKACLVSTDVLISEFPF